MTRTGTRSTWDLLEAMDWDKSDVEPTVPTQRSGRRPPPIPIKVKDASGKPVTQRKLPGVHEEVPDPRTGAPDRRSTPRPGQPDRRRFDKPTRQLFVPDSFDVTVPGEGTYRVPAKSAVEARQAVITWFLEDQEPGQERRLDPGTLSVVRTPSSEQNESASFDATAWNVRNKKTGQVFTHISGRTPMDAKKRVLANNPLLRNITPLDLEADPMSDMTRDHGVAMGSLRDPSQATPGSTDTSDQFGDEETTLADPPSPAPRRGARMRPEGAGVANMGANGPMDRDTFKEAVKSMVREIVRKKAGGGGYALYAPNKGKKKSPKPVGEFPTRLAAKNAELARFPPKDPEQLKAARARLDKLKKDPKKRAAAEKPDLSGRKKPKRTGAPARDRKKRKESIIRLMARDLHERLFHEDEVPGSPWDEKIASLHPDAISSDRKLHALHRGMEKACIGALGDAHKGLSKVLRGVVKVNPGDISFDGERKKTFMPVMLDCDGMEIGPVHLYVDGGHIKIEVSREAREAIAQLEPDTARNVRGGLMSFEEDHLPKIDGAQKAWRERDAYLDKLHGRLQKHAAGLSGVEHHLMKGLLTKGGKK